MPPSTYVPREYISMQRHILLLQKKTRPIRRYIFFAHVTSEKSLIYDQRQCSAGGDTAAARAKKKNDAAVHGVRCAAAARDASYKYVYSSRSALLVHNLSIKAKLDQCTWP